MSCLPLLYEGTIPVKIFQHSAVAITLCLTPVQNKAMMIFGNLHVLYLDMSVEAFSYTFNRVYMLHDALTFPEVFLYKNVYYKLWNAL